MDLQVSKVLLQASSFASARFQNTRRPNCICGFKRFGIVKSCISGLQGFGGQGLGFRVRV